MLVMSQLKHKLGYNCLIPGLRAGYNLVMSQLKHKLGYNCLIPGLRAGYNVGHVSAETQVRV